jgi:hypothetical protein
MSHRLSPALAGLLCCALPFVAFAGYPTIGGIDYEKLQKISERMETSKQAAVQDLLRGRPDVALARLDKAAGKDWMSRFALANMTWTMFPDEAFTWHRDAYERGGRKPMVLIELALHYTRHEQCTEALAAWKEIDNAGFYNDYFPMLGAYCHLKLGHDREAFADVDRAKVGGHSQLGNVLVELWGPPPPEVVHARAMAAFRATPDAEHLSKALTALENFPLDTAGMTAADALAEAVADSPLRDGEAGRALSCMRPAFHESAPRGPAWKQALAKCNLLVGADTLPADSTLAHLLVVWALRADAIGQQQLLDWHGKTFDARAHSEAGDFQALELLAGLQSAVKDSAGLGKTDDYGWSRYKAPKYAASGFLGQVIADGKPTPASVARIDRAHAELPDDPMLLSFWLQYGTVPEAQAAAAWRKLALAEFHAPSAANVLHVGYGPSLANLALALREYRKHAMPADAKTASTEP